MYCMQTSSQVFYIVLIKSCEMTLNRQESENDSDIDLFENGDVR